MGSPFCDSLVEIEERLYHRRFRTCLREPQSVLGEGPAELSVGENALERTREGACVLRRNKQRILPVREQLAEAANLRGDKWATRGERFERCDGKPFGARGED